MDYDAEGFTLAYKLQDDPQTHDIPIVILSGFTEHLETKAPHFEPIMGREWPAAKFFQKPVELRELAATVAALTADEARQGLTVRSVEEIVEAHEGLSREQLIPLLQEIQVEQGYVSRPP